VVTRETCFVSLVQAQLKGMVRNISRFGSTLLRGIGKTETDIAKGPPDVVLIEYGGNDCDFLWKEIAAHPEVVHQPQTDLEVFEQALTQMVSSLKQQDIEPVLMNLPPLNADSYLTWVSEKVVATEKSILSWLGSVTKIYWWQERYSAAIVWVAEATQTRWIDIRGSFLRRPDFNALICRDGIHPNAAGHLLMAETIVDYVTRNFSRLIRT